MKYGIKMDNYDEQFFSNDTRTRFGYFYDSPTSTWVNAQLNCISWGGNLATIKSEEEDSLLYYSTTDIPSPYGCYIGLNDILNEAGADGAAYTWVDSSSSAYRNFETGFPNNLIDRDCVQFRDTFGGILSDGWNSKVCSIGTNCHFCTKTGKKIS